MPWYFIPRVLKLATVKMDVRNGYDEESETVNVLLLLCTNMIKVL